MWLSDRQNYSLRVRTKTPNMRSISDQEYPFFARHSVPVTVPTPAPQYYGVITRAANPTRRVAPANEFCIAGPNICGPSVLSRYLASRNFRQLLLIFFGGGEG